MNSSDTPPIKFKNVTFTYPTAAEETQLHALQNLTLKLPAGTATLLTGPSGCGKSTALRIMNGLIPHLSQGTLTGTATIAGRNTAQSELAEIGALTATIFQNPRNQFFTATVGEEIAFTRQQLGQKLEEITTAVNDAATLLGIDQWLNRSLWEMSGGELQTVACGTALASPANIYLFDEPTSNLSPAAIKTFTNILTQMKASGATLVIAEHRLSFLKGIIDTVLTLEDGKITATHDAKSFYAISDQERRAAGWRTLHPPKVNNWEEAPERASDLEGNGVELRDIKYAYDKMPVLNFSTLAFPSGKITALTGPNGAGKTTLCRILTGLTRPQKGASISLNKKKLSDRERRATSSYVMQDVNRQLFTEYVLAEVLTGTGATKEEALDLLTELDLHHVQTRHPHSLSGGQKQRLVIATALAAKSAIVVLDEPTSGVDYRHMQAISKTLQKVAARGTSVVVVTHDMEFVNACADRLIRLEPIAENQTNPITVLRRKAGFGE